MYAVEKIIPIYITTYYPCLILFKPEFSFQVDIIN